MPELDKFSFALKRGFNELSQVSKVSMGHDGELFARVSYFKFNKNESGGVDIPSFGFRSISESEVQIQKETLEKKGIKGAYFEMLNQVENTFNDIHSEELVLDKVNETLKQKTEQFYDTYIAGEVLTQTYNPIGRAFMPEKPEDPKDAFNYRRNLQILDERIGTTSEIPHSEIRDVFGLD